MNEFRCSSSSGCDRDPPAPPAGRPRCARWARLPVAARISTGSLTVRNRGPGLCHTGMIRCGPGPGVAAAAA